MNSTAKKITLSLILIFFILFSGLMYFVSSKISPREVREVATTKLKEAFPEAIVTVGELDYSLGFNISFNVAQIKIQQPNKDVVCKVWRRKHKRTF